MAARLAHPNIVPIYSVEEIGDFVFYAMRYIAGETPGERIDYLMAAASEVDAALAPSDATGHHQTSQAQPIASAPSTSLG